jgi:PIN domain nuclease of toxin-antitoxin system
MRLLLDTHTLLWFLADAPRLSTTAKAALVDSDNERLLAPISLVEIALKTRLGKLELSADFGTLFPAQLTLNRINLLSMDTRHIEPLTSMPLLHRDPFDRLIAATALVEGLSLVSADSMFDPYGVSRIW